MRLLFRFPLRFTIPAALVLLATVVSLFVYQSLRARVEVVVEQRLEGLAEFVLSGVDTQFRNACGDGGAGADRRSFAWLDRHPLLKAAALIDASGGVVPGTQLVWRGASGPGSAAFRVTPPPAEDGPEQIRREGGSVVAYRRVPFPQAAGGPDGLTDAWLFVELDYDAACREAQRAALGQLVGTTVFLLALAAFLSWWLGRTITRRVESLIAVTRRISDGDLKARPDVEGQDEIAQLGHAVGRMATHIGETLDDRRRAEEESEQARSLLQSTVDALSSHIAVLDEHGTILTVNAAWAGFAAANGLTGVDFRGQSYLRACDAARGPGAADAREVAAGVRRVLSGVRDQFYYEYACHAPDEQRWFGLRVTRVSGDGPARAVVAHEDVTPRVLAEQAIRGNVERYRGLVESSFDLILSLQPDGRFRFVNRAWLQRLGYAEEDVGGLCVGGVLAPAAPGNDRAAFDRALSGEAVRSCRTVFLARSGEEILVEGNLTPQCEGGRVVVVHGFFHDITDRVNAENEVRALNADLERRVAERTAELESLNRALHEEITERAATEAERARLVAILEASPDFIGIADPRGRVVYANGAGRGLARRAGPGPGRKLLDYHPAWARRRVLDEAVPAAVRGGFWLGESAVLAADGREVPVSQLLLAHRNAAGRVEYFSTIMRDITDRKQLEQTLRARSDELAAANRELARAARMKDEFLANMSHELRTPLHGVLSLTEALQEHAYGPVNGEQAEALHDVRESSRHLLTLINDILDLSKIEAGKLTLEPGPTCVAETCQASLRLVKELALKKGLRASVRIDDAVGTIVADQRRLKQILVNLLSNAVKFTPDGGALGLDVAGDQARGVVTFTVWDTGIGIPAADLPRLFRPFTQLDSRLSRQYAGTGLGLALVWRMTELHGGSVAVESEPGQGSRFVVTLPWCEADSIDSGPGGPALAPRLRNAPPPQRSAAAPARPLLLLVEDNEVNARSLAHYLRRQGYDLVVACDGDQAVERTRADRPDAILMDLQMPGTDGLEATRRIRADGPGGAVPIVAMTALAMPGDRDRCFEAGADAYLSKPIVLRELKEVLDRVLPREPGARLLTCPLQAVS